MLDNMRGASWKYEFSVTLMLMVLACWVIRLNSRDPLVFKFYVYLQTSKIFSGSRLA